MVRHGWIVAGALAFAGASVLAGIQCEPVAAEVFRAAGGAGIALVFERLGDAGEIGRWVRTGDALRFRVSLEGMGSDARLAVATSPANALTSMTCPSLPAGGLLDAGPGIVGGPGDQAVEGRTVPGGQAVPGGQVSSGLAVPGGQAVQGGQPTVGQALPGGQDFGSGQASPDGQSVGRVHASGGALAARTAALNALAAGEAADGQASMGGRSVAGLAASRGVLASGPSSTLAATLRTALVPTAPAASASGVTAPGVVARGVMAQGVTARGVGASGVRAQGMSAPSVAAPGGTHPGGGVAPGGVAPGVVPGARVCALGDVAGDRSVDVLLTVPSGPKEVVLTAAARARDTSGGFATVVGSTTTSVKAPVSAPARASGRPAAPVATLPKGARGQGAVRGEAADDSVGTLIEIPRGDVTLSGRAVRVQRGAEDARPDKTAVAGSVRPRNGHTAKSHLRMVSAGHAHASSAVPNGTAVQVPAPELRREPALTLPQVPQVLPPPTSGLGAPGVGGTSGVGTGGMPRAGAPALSAPQGGTPAGGAPGLGTPGFGAGAGAGWGAMTSAEEVGPPLPFAIPGNRFQPAERVNPLAGARGLPWVASGIAVLLGALWLVARAQRARLRRKVL
ncbi:hypothetical protein [Nonomuraea sp. NPDC049129]|uniref:hypothetical protein n=1 Tax=Nonomuraea sp. NPDC049129 TaxID=3155272 RepID=UPI0033CD552A